MPNLDTIKKSPLVFPFLLGLAFSLGFLIANEEGVNKYIFSAFVIAVWVIGLCFHEFAHAFSAYKFGDFTIANKGYLTLNPLLFGNLATSFVLPVLILLIGGLPLPGGAVYINQGNIIGRFNRALTFFFGPIANLLFAVLLFFLFKIFETSDANSMILYALAISTYLQIYTFIFNLLPIPGFDGFGVISQFFNTKMRNSILMHRAEGLAFILIIVAFYSYPEAFLWLQIASAKPLIGLGMKPEYIINAFDYFLPTATQR